MFSVYLRRRDNYKITLENKRYRIRSRKRTLLEYRDAIKRRPTNQFIVLSCAFQLFVVPLLGLARGQGYFQEPEKLVSESRDLGDTRGHYSFSYETEGGILQRESGSRKYAGTADETQLIQGSVQYNAPDGTPIAMSWTADEFGTQVSGSHIPTPPPIPPAIQRALEWIAKQPSTPEPIEKDSPAQNVIPQQSRDNRQFRLPANKRN